MRRVIVGCVYIIGLLKGLLFGVLSDAQGKCSVCLYYTTGSVASFKTFSEARGRCRVCLNYRIVSRGSF